MNEKTKENVSRVAKEEFPDCLVTFGPGDNQIRIELRGKVISTKEAIPGLSVPLETDDQIRAHLHRICPNN
jgi:hypothetical protein